MLSDQIILGKIIVKWLGHSAFKIKYNNYAIYIDPYEIEGPHEAADVILITHAHYDHCDKKSIDALRKPATVIFAPASVVPKVQGAKAVEYGQKLDILGIKIKVVPAYNMSRPYHPRGGGAGYLLTLGTNKVYHAGDTDLIPEMKDLDKENIDIALLPIGGTYTMDEAEASEAVSIIRPKTAIPMHYGKVVRGDPWKFKQMVGTDASVTVLDR